MRDAITDISLHVEEARTKLLLETVTAQYKGVDSDLLAVLESLIDHIVKRVLISPRIIAEVTGAVIYSAVFVTIASVLVKLEEGKRTDDKLRIEERCRWYVEAGMKVDPVAVSSPPETGENPPTDISVDFKTGQKAHLIATLCRSSDHQNEEKRNQHISTNTYMTFIR